MIKTILAAIAVSCLAVAASAQVSFDQGVDVKAAISQAAASDVAVPAVPAATRGTYDRDCVRFRFGPSDEEITSRKVYLRSTELETVCHTVMVPGPDGTQVPHQSCHEQAGMTWHRYAQIKVNPRELFPWERDVFEVCLRGPWLDIYGRDTAYRYDAKREGSSYDTLFTLTAREKTPMDPDEEGVSYAGFSYVDGKFVFKASDKWAKEYAGEKIVIKVDLYKDNWWIFDGYRGSKEFTFDASEGYEMSFTEDDLAKPEVEDDMDDFRGASKYYLKWGFTRVGKISTDDFVKKGKTPTITR